MVRSLMLRSSIGAVAVLVGFSGVAQAQLFGPPAAIPESLSVPTTSGTVVSARPVISPSPGLAARPVISARPVWSARPGLPVVSARPTISSPPVYAPTTVGGGMGTIHGGGDQAYVPVPTLPGTGGSASVTAGRPAALSGGAVAAPVITLPRPYVPGQPLRNVLRAFSP